MGEYNFKISEEAWNLYTYNMQIIKFRLQAIDDLMTGKARTSFKITNTEFCVLQIRKILELIALSALVSDAELYREKLESIEKKWNAKLIMHDIEEIHPNFYPTPVHFENDELTILPDDGSYLNLKKFEKIYDRCGKFLHTLSPFAGEDEVKNGKLFKNQKDIDALYEQVWGEIPDWTKLISRLLSAHIVQLYNEKYVCCIELGDKNELPCWTMLQSCE